MQAGNGVPAERLGAKRRKSSAGNRSGSCVEIAALADRAVVIRNSRHPAGPTLIYMRAEIASFLTGVKKGEFDHRSVTTG